VSELVLPDSRLKHHKIGTEMVQWRLPGGGTVRIEAEKIYCANCGKFWGHVPRENTTFSFFLCAKCFETHGTIANTWVQPDEEFVKDVAFELEKRFGPGGGTVENIARALEDNTLGPELMALLNDSPFPSHDHRPKG